MAAIAYNFKTPLRELEDMDLDDYDYWLEQLQHIKQQEQAEVDRNGK